jgi:hypothetical protein
MQCVIDPLKRDNYSPVLPSTNLTFHLFHPDKDGPKSKEPKMIDKVEAFFLNTSHYPQDYSMLQGEAGVQTKNAEESTQKSTIAIDPNVCIQLKSSLKRNLLLDDVNKSVESNKLSLKRGSTDLVQELARMLGRMSKRL